jgi:uncharacterized protein
MMKRKARLFKRVKIAVPTTSRRGGESFYFFTRQLLVLPIRAYQHLISPLMVDCCRWHPSCSSYTKEAIIKYGATRGMWLGIKRLVRCHPWGGSGYDPVP